MNVRRTIALYALACIGTAVGFTVGSTAVVVVGLTVVFAIALGWRPV